ncbi:MAG: PspC domain-containing protein [Bacillota bacterium]
MRERFFGLHRAEHDRLVAGVCGGLAASLGLDSTLVRLAWVIFTLASPWLGLGFYLLAWFILPFKASTTGMEGGLTSLLRGQRLGRLLGGLLVVLGIYYLVEELTYGACGRFLAELRRYLWPIFFIAVGGLLLLPGKDAEASPGGGTEGFSRAPDGHRG